MIDVNAVRREEHAAIDDLDRRLAAVEAENHTLRTRQRAMLAALGALAACAVVAAAPVATVPDTLAAKRFALVDAAGAVRALWRLGDAGAEFALLDGDGASERVVALVPASPAPAEAAPGPRSGAADDGGFLRFGKPEQPDDEAEDDSFDWVE
jgi:hypothetical protein